MMEEGCYFERDEKDHEHYGSNAEDHHCERKKADGKDHLAKVKPRGGAHIEIEVGMMHVMKAPEKRHHVIGPVPPPVGIVHQQKRRDGSGPRWKREPVQQTDTLFLCHIATAIGIGNMARRTIAKPGVESTKLRTRRCSTLKCWRRRGNRHSSKSSARNRQPSSGLPT